ncbi:unnamed protein product [Allacma fusca]|uniref:Uncharacterized protein n=1 Tax=Allacma fusca TaxID=39272 RepID=A0A8J2P4J7_9HEXA|nr:unnamed protein product [Allacma fusca]
MHVLYIPPECDCLLPASCKSLRERIYILKAHSGFPTYQSGNRYKICSLQNRARMCANDHDPEPELADLEKIKFNLWTVTDNTKKVSDLCEKFEGLFTSDERDYLNDLRDEQLKCFSFYANFLRKHKKDDQSLLLEALRSTGNSQVADQIKKTSPERPILKARKPALISGLKQSPEDRQPLHAGRPLRNQCEIKGKNCTYTTPESLRISKSLQHKLTSLSLSDLQISLPLLQSILKPCVSLENLDLQNVVFSCPLNAANETGGAVMLPQLKSYTFFCDNESSVNYSWSTLFFFTLYGNRPPNLLNLWKNKILINVKSQSMEISMNDSTVAFKLPKKEFYDSPEFRCYIEKESVISFLKELSNVESLVCLLPSGFESVKFQELPMYELKDMHISGLNIIYNCDDQGNSCRPYKNILLEKCELTQDFLDNVSIIFPNARSILLKDCPVEGENGADVSIIFK